VFGITLYDGTSNFPFPAATPGIGALGTTQLAYGQIPLPAPFGSGTLGNGAFSPNTTGLNTASVTKNFLMVQAPGFIRGINPKSKI